MLCAFCARSVCLVLTHSGIRVSTLCSCTECCVHGEGTIIKCHTLARALTAVCSARRCHAPSNHMPASFCHRGGTPVWMDCYVPCPAPGAVITYTTVHTQTRTRARARTHAHAHIQSHIAQLRIGPNPQALAAAAPAARRAGQQQHKSPGQQRRDNLHHPCSQGLGVEGSLCAAVL